MNKSVPVVPVVPFDTKPSVIVMDSDTSSLSRFVELISNMRKEQFGLGDTLRRVNEKIDVMDKVIQDLREKQERIGAESDGEDFHWLTTASKIRLAELLEDLRELIPDYDPDDFNKSTLEDFIYDVEHTINKQIFELINLENEFNHFSYRMKKETKKQK